MKKSILAVLMLLASILPVFAQDNSTQSEAGEEAPDFNFYYLDQQEMNIFIQAWSWLKHWDSGEIKVESYEKFAQLYENNIGQDNLISMLWENFFRQTENPEIKKYIKEYIKKNRLRDRPYEKTLWKKLYSEKKVTKTKDETMIQYSYNEEEFDENINLFDFEEIHPFRDQFGVLLLKNNWHVMNFVRKDGSATENPHVFYMFGGGTNALTVTFEETGNIESEEDLKKAVNMDKTAEKYGENWNFMELEKKGVIANSGADNYYIGFGVGQDAFVPEISAGDFAAILYNKELKKVFKMQIFMNFSKINMNYEIRNSLYNYLLFYTLFAFCE